MLSRAASEDLTCLPAITTWMLFTISMVPWAILVGMWRAWKKAVLLGSIPVFPAGTMTSTVARAPQATHILSSLKPSSECDTILENISESSPQPGQAAARVLVVDSSQECKVSPQNHRVLSQHPCQEAEPSLTGLGQMLESPVTKYFGNHAFLEVLSEDNCFKKQMMAGHLEPLDLILKVVKPQMRKAVLQSGGCIIPILQNTTCDHLVLWPS